MSNVYMYEHSVGIENAGYQEFFLFLQCVQETFSQGESKSSLCGKRLNGDITFIIITLIME